MSTTPINPGFNTLNAGKSATTPSNVVDLHSGNNGPSFGSFLGDARDSIQSAEKTATGMIAGQNKTSIVDAVAQIAEAEVKLTAAKTILEKGVGAYKEINGMQL